MSPLSLPAPAPFPERVWFGKKPTLTRLQDIELWAWDQARLYIGTIKSKARELQVPEYVVQEAIMRMRRRHARRLERERRR